MSHTPQFPTYENYKDSGIPWLGKIPNHWGLQKLKYLADFTERGTAPVYADEGITVINQSCLSSYKLDITKAKFHHSKEDPTTFKGWLKKGDFLIASTGLGVLGKCALFDSDESAFVDSHVTIVRDSKNRISTKYLYYLLSTQYDMINACLSEGSTKQTELQRDDFKSLRLPTPPEKDVTRIVEFLDQKTAEIDAAIAKKQQLIQLLNEQKAILINRAVTKGLNPNVKMKDSGVAWIGEIPKHWGAIKLKYFSSVQTGITLGKTYSGNALEEYPYMRVANVQDGYFKLDDVATLRLPAREAQKYIIRAGDILVTEGGDIDKLGRGTVWRGEIDNCLHQNHVFCVRINTSKATEEFIALVTSCEYGRHYFTNTANKTTNLASTNRTKLVNLPVALPPLGEQAEIIAYVSSITEAFAPLVEAVQRESECLREFKQVLISGVTTGKIRV